MSSLITCFANVEGEEKRTTWMIRQVSTLEDVIKTGCQRLHLSDSSIFDAFDVSEGQRHVLEHFDEVLLMNRHYELVCRQEGIGNYHLYIYTLF